MRKLATYVKDNNLNTKKSRAIDKNSPAGSDIVGTLLEELQKEAREEAWEKGKKEGKEEELQKTAIKLLINNLEGLSKEYKEKIREQDLEELEVIVENIMDIEKEEDLEKYLD